LISWRKELRIDPVPGLLSSGNIAIKYFTLHDLCDRADGSVETLWNLPEVRKILKKQENNGSWSYSGKRAFEHSDYDQYQTYLNLAELVEKYGLNKDHESIEKASEFLFNFQSHEGDFRGLYGNQYSTTYSPAIMEILIKAGYGDDPRISRGFDQLLSIRQDDGGWALPFRTVGKNLKDAFETPEPIEPDKTRPFSHMATGTVLRAFAAHPKYRKSHEAKRAGELLITRFFKSDKYPDRRSKDYWERVTFPFLYTDIVSALDSLYYLGFNMNNPEIRSALKLLKEKQNQDGTFNIKITRGSDKHLPYWICLAVCKLFKGYYSPDL
jgi:hypothetical protein